MLGNIFSMAICLGANPFNADICLKIKDICIFKDISTLKYRYRYLYLSVFRIQISLF